MPGAVIQETSMLSSRPMAENAENPMLNCD